MTDVLQSDSIAKLMPALIAAKQAFAPAVKDSINPAFRSKYVSLDGVIDAVDGPLLANGIATVQQTDHDPQFGTVLLTRLIHSSGEWIGSRYVVRPVKQDPQGEGSALTYARRYALMALVGIAPEDDDGNAATASGKPPKAKQAGDIPPAADFEALIRNAKDLPELNALGTKIATTEMDPAERAKLRELFHARAKSLPGAAA